MVRKSVQILSYLTEALLLKVTLSLVLARVIRYSETVASDKHVSYNASERVLIFILTGNHSTPNILQIMVKDGESSISAIPESSHRNLGILYYVYILGMES